MIIIEVDDSKGGIEKALKNYKKKFNNLKVGKELRERKEFQKPSEIRRSVILKAIYKEEKRNENLD
jgi:small subunit ribosomal protein S21